jgi:antitoxin MazE
VRTRIVKWFNSLGLRIPQVFAAEIRVAAGTEVELSLEEGQILTPVEISYIILPIIT